MKWPIEIEFEPMTKDQLDSCRRWLIGCSLVTAAILILMPVLFIGCDLRTDDEIKKAWDGKVKQVWLTNVVQLVTVTNKPPRFNLTTVIGSSGYPPGIYIVEDTLYSNAVVITVRDSFVQVVPLTVQQPKIERQINGKEIESEK